MTQNLRLVGSKTLTSSNSDVTTNYVLPASSTSGWCIDQNSTCINKQNVLYSGNTSYGTYYSWAAATAGTGTYSLASGDAPSSVCPKGWRIPARNMNEKIYSLYNSLSALQGIPNYELGGEHFGDITRNQGSIGLYWSSTTQAVNSHAVYFHIDSSTITASLGNLKYTGFTIRCVAR